MAQALLKSVVKTAAWRRNVYSTRTSICSLFRNERNGHFAHFGRAL